MRQRKYRVEPWIDEETVHTDSKSKWKVGDCKTCGKQKIRSSLWQAHANCQPMLTQPNIASTIRSKDQIMQ